MAETAEGPMPRSCWGTYTLVSPDSRLHSPSGPTAPGEIESSPGPLPPANLVPPPAQGTLLPFTACFRVHTPGVHQFTLGSGVPSPPAASPSVLSRTHPPSEAWPVSPLLPARRFLASDSFADRPHARFSSERPTPVPLAQPWGWEAESSQGTGVAVCSSGQHSLPPGLRLAQRHPHIPALTPLDHQDSGLTTSGCCHQGARPHTQLWAPLSPGSRPSVW